jgi:hypothetical protein
MATEPIHFATGRVLSTDAVTTVTAGTNRADLSTAEVVAKNKQWRLTAAAAGANMLRNVYRAEVTVDNSAGNANAWLVITTSDDPSYTLGYTSVPGGGKQTFRVGIDIGTESMSVVLDGASASDCVVSERSFV